MRIVVIGTRGIPDILGGVETHCQKLYPILAKKGLDITLVRRSCYLTDENKNMDSFEGIKLKNIYAPKVKSIEAIVHTFLSVLYAKRVKADVLHIHAIGPAILTYLANILGLNVVVTHHGPDYDRQKWGKLAKSILKKGEKNAVRYSNQLIVISDVIKESIRKLYKREERVNLIYNGVDIPIISTSEKYISALGLQKKSYIVALGRFVEEKGFHNLIEVYSKSDIKDKFKLVIAGDADHETEYSKRLREQALVNDVVLTGFIKGEQLNELMSHATLFVLPSFHEGLPISLLEAMSYNLDVLVSAIPANLEVGLSHEDYFKPDDLIEFRLKLEQKLMDNKQLHMRKYDLSKYDWSTIALKTEAVYASLNLGEK